MDKWKQEIPWIAVDPGVPVIPVVMGCGTKPVMCLGTGRGGYTMKVMTQNDGVMTTKATNWRVNLEDPLGFMFALRWLHEQYKNDCSWDPLFSGRMDIARGEASAADILHLASEMKKSIKSKEGSNGQDNNRIAKGRKGSAVEVHAKPVG